MSRLVRFRFQFLPPNLSFFRHLSILCVLLFRSADHGGCACDEKGVQFVTHKAAGCYIFCRHIYNRKKRTVFCASLFYAAATSEGYPEIIFCIDAHSVCHTAAFFRLKQNLAVGDFACFQIIIIFKNCVLQGIWKIKLFAVKASGKSIGNFSIGLLYSPLRHFPDKREFHSLHEYHHPQKSQTKHDL